MQDRLQRPHRAVISLVLPIISLAAAVAAPGSRARGGALDAVVADVSRSTVALEVERDRDEPSIDLARLGLRSTRLATPDVVDYYRRPSGPASGILLDAEGNILTTHYNVAGKVRSIYVVLPDGQRRAANLIATDKSDDLALVRLQEVPAGLNVAPVRWSEPNALRVGKMLIAVGRSPDPMRPTVTYGIISALGRNGGRAMQTDAKLNYGNVGGPLALLDGSVAGIAGFVGHTFPLWGLNSGIGFGTKAETIQAVLPRLLKGENVPPPEIPFFGVGPSNLPAAGNVGARIGEVAPGSAAEKANLRVNDVVLTFDGEKVEDFLDLRRLINRHRPGDEVTLRVRRGDEELELKARMGKRSE